MKLDDLALLDHVDLATWIKPRPVDADRGNLMVQAAVEAVRQAVGAATEVPAMAKFVVLEAAARAYAPRVQQESLGSRSVSYFAPDDPRSGVFLTEEELQQLMVVPSLGVGVIRTMAWNGAGGWR